jgi:type IV secretory pathway TrbL component
MVFVWKGRIAEMGFVLLVRVVQRIIAVLGFTQILVPILQIAGFVVLFVVQIKSVSMDCARIKKWIITMPGIRRLVLRMTVKGLSSV